MVVLQIANVQAFELVLSADHFQKFSEETIGERRRLVLQLVVKPHQFTLRFCKE